MLPHVIRYNGRTPTELTSWPRYEHYGAPERSQQIAAVLDGGVRHVPRRGRRAPGAERS